MKEYIGLSEAGYLAVTRYIATLWGFSKLQSNPMVYILTDIDWHWSMDNEIRIENSDPIDNDPIATAGTMQSYRDEFNIPQYESLEDLKGFDMVKLNQILSRKLQ